MRVSGALSILLTIVLALLPTTARPCGDKFLVQLDQDFRSGELPLGKAPHRAKILVFRPNPTGRVPESSDIELLRRVGHSVQICDTASLCSSAITSGSVQIVLADSRDLKTLGIDTSRAQARILPVVSKASRQDKIELKERYGAYFDSGAPPGKLLAMVDRMLSR